MKKYITLIFSFYFLLSIPASAFAQEQASPDIQKLVAIVEELTRQVHDLQQKINALLLKQIGVTVDVSFNATGLSGVTVTPVDIIPPTISDIAISGISSTTATISWNTDELATGFVYFATSTPLVRSRLAPFGSSIWNTKHVLNLIDLEPDNLYHFAAESEDATENTTLSSERTFITPAK